MNDKGGENMNKESKSIQLEQKIIHLKSELEKYKTIIASMQIEQQFADINKQIDQLKTDNNNLKNIFKKSNELITNQKHEMKQLINEVQQIKDSYSQLQSSTKEYYSDLKGYLDKIEESIQLFFDTYYQFENEKQIITEQAHTLRKEIDEYQNQLADHHSLRSIIISFMERINSMEKEHDFSKKSGEKILGHVEEISKKLSNQKEETELLKEAMQSLADKISTFETMLNGLDKEQQKNQNDIINLKQKVSHQHIEIENLFEKTAHFSTGIEKIAHQISELKQLTECAEKKKEEHTTPDINEMKEMLMHVIQLLSKQKKGSNTEKTEREKDTTGFSEAKTTPPTNSFLKLQQFSNETNQPIVVSPIQKKNQPSPSKLNQIKPKNTDKSNITHIRSKNKEDDDEQLSNLTLPTTEYYVRNVSSSDVLNSLSKNSEDTIEFIFEPPFDTVSEEPILNLTIPRTDYTFEKTDLKNMLDKKNSSQTLLQLNEESENINTESETTHERKRSWLLALFERVKLTKP